MPVDVLPQNWMRREAGKHAVGDVLHFQRRKPDCFSDIGPGMLKIDKDCYSGKYCESGGAAMNVSLTPELEKFVADKVKSGRYNSASEVVREALRLLEEHEKARGVQLAAFNQELGARLVALDAGEHSDSATAKKRLQRKSTERKRRSA
jgi:antitoxin ParD1/3/4